MLPKQKRITKKDFIGVKPRVVFRGNYIDVATAPSDTERFTCIVSKKRIKKATDRNRAKRKVYNILSKVKIKNPSLFFVYPKHTTVSANHKTLSEEINKAFATL